jgi:hypothetical protein
MCIVIFHEAVCSCCFVFCTLALPVKLPYISPCESALHTRSFSMSQALQIACASVSSWTSSGRSACSRAEVSGISAHAVSYPGKGGAKDGAVLYRAPLK